MPTYSAHDELPIAAAVSPGEPVLLLSHATGFCKEVWGPVAAALPGFGLVAVDQRGHGDSGSPPLPFDWWDLGRDLVTAAAEAGAPHPIGVGHSSGAAALIMAEILDPGRFSALVLIEPIVFPPPYRRYEDLPLAVAAERRRPSFPSRLAIVEAFRGRGIFARWVDEAVEAYVDGGFRESGGEWFLKCRPKVEAEWYRTATAHGVWDRLGEVACPAVVVGGADSSSHPASLLQQQADLLGDGRVEIVPGSTHFVPMEDPGAVARLVRELAR